MRKYDYMNPMGSGSSLDYEESDSFKKAPETQTYFGPGYSVNKESYEEPVQEEAAVPFMQSPAGAAAVIGSRFLSDYLKQKAAAEEAKFQREQKRISEQGEGERQAYNTMLGAWGRALR